MDMKKGYGDPLEDIVKNDASKQETMQELDSSLQKVTENIFGGDVYSIGSSASGTYVPNNHGMADDVDFSVERNNSSISELVSKLNDYKDRVVNTVSQYMPLKNPKLKIEETKDEGEYKQIRATIKDGIKDVLGIDLNYNASDYKLDASDYRTTFHNQLDNIVANMDDKKAGKGYITSQIREMKKCLKDNNVYKAKEGGLRGIGVEQLMVGLADKAYDNMGELKQEVNVENAFKKIEQENYNLKVEHPNTGENLADNLYNIDKKGYRGWDKMRPLVENYKQNNSKPAGSNIISMSDNIVQYYEKSTEPKQRYAA